MSTPEDQRDAPTTTHNAIRWGFYVGIVALVAIASLGQRGFIFDDPFIFFRYARNLGSGHGWVYNLGQSGYNGATSPLYVVVLAGAYQLTHNLVLVSQIIFVASLSACAILTDATLRRLGHSAAGMIAALLVATSPWIFISRGMETTLFLAVFALSVFLWVAESEMWLGASLGALILLRPDGIILAVVAALLWWRRSRAMPFKMVAIAVAVVGAWAIYALIAVGQILPGTLAAKIAQQRSGYFTGPFWQGLWTVPRSYHFALLVWTIVAVAVVGLVAAVRKRDLDNYVVLVAATAALTYLGYSVLNVPQYTWYYALPVYALVVLSAIGFEWAATSLRQIQYWPWVATAVIVGLLGIFGLIDTPTGPPRPGYQSAASWITSNTPRGATIASAEIGLLGWYSNHPMVDYDGLLNSNVIPALRRGDMIAWINMMKPDYWMVEHNPFLQDIPPLYAPWFTKTFTQVYTNSHVIIYRRLQLTPTGPLSMVTLGRTSTTRRVYFWTKYQAQAGIGPYVWSISAGTLPPGLKLETAPYNYTEAIITGTPTSDGTFHFTLRVRGGSSNASSPSNNVNQAVVMNISG